MDDLDDIAAKIAALGGWEVRWEGFCGVMQRLAAECSPRTLRRVVAPQLASRVVAQLGAPPVGELHQALIYLASAAPAHRNASHAWQAGHPAELAAFQRAHPRHDLLSTGGTA